MKASDLIKERQAKTKAEAMMNGFSFDKQRKLERKQKELRNEKVRRDAETVYQAYLHAGKEVAEERKKLYLERNLEK